MVTIEEGRLKDFLQTTVKNFANDRLAVQNIRRFSENLPELLIEVGVEMLLDQPDAAGIRYLATQLLRQPKFFHLITDPWRYTVEQSVKLGRRLLAVDHSLDIKLARCLPPRSGNVDKWILTGMMAERALEILDEISVGRRVVPVLNHLTGHPDSRISSKATLMVGKRVLNLSWARRLLEEGNDPRVRANAIEAFWGIDTKPAVQLFRQSLKDKHNRVVGNSMMGLHLAGQTDLRRIVNKFVEDPKPEFRMTTAWIMGKLGDAAYAEPLTKLIRDTDPSVRGAALRSLKDIRQLENWRKAEEPPKEAAMDELVKEPTVAVPEIAAVPVADSAPTKASDLAVNLWLDGARFSSGSRVIRR